MNALRKIVGKNQTTLIMKKLLLITFSFIFILSSCVSSKKYKNSQSRVSDLSNDSTNTHQKLTDCNIKLVESNNKVFQLKRDNNEVQNDLENLSTSSQAAINSSKMTIAEQARRLRDLQNLIQAQNDVMLKLKQSIGDALVNFKPDELSVSYKDGKIYVSLQEKLLFKSGSDLVDPKGKEALKSVANILNGNTDINVMIEGHTDSIPVSGKFSDNWALSVSRATAIVRILATDYKVDAHRITASGRGEFSPIARNIDSEGRARNRRTEIILSPNLNKLFELLSQ